MLGDVRVTPTGARLLMSVCLGIPAFVFALRLSSHDRTDPYKKYEDYEKREQVPEHVPGPVPPEILRRQQESAKDS